MSKTESWNIVLTWMLILVIVAACTPVLAQPGGSFRYAETEPPIEFNPHRLTENRGPTDRLFALIYETLVVWDYNRDAYDPLLAESWQVSSDHTKLTFTLRSNVTWQDGAKFTANDVAMTFRYIQEKGSARAKDYVKSLKSVEAVDEVTVVATLKRATSEGAALSVFGDMWIIPQHAFDGRLNPVADREISSKPIGTGPYKFVRRRPQDGGVELEANTSYWRKKPNITRAGMEYVPDETTLVQMALFMRDMNLIDAPTDGLLQLEEAGIQIIPYPSYTIHTVGFNFGNPILKDEIVRLAITQAVDRAQLLEQWYNGRGNVLNGPFVQGSPYHDISTRPIEYNPGEAGRKLDAAGYSDRDNDGIRETPDGSPMKLRLLVRASRAASSTKEQNVANSIRSYLLRIGIDVQLEVRDLETYLELRRTYRFDMVQTTWTFGANYDVTDLFHSSGIFEGGNNFIQFRDGTVDKLLDLFAAETDADRRRVHMRTLQKILQVKQPYIFLYSVPTFAAIQRNYINTKIHPYYFFSYFADWEVL